MDAEASAGVQKAAGKNDEAAAAAGRLDNGSRCENLVFFAVRCSVGVEAAVTV